MDKNNICLWGASKQSAFFKKFGLKNPLIPTVSILGPALKSESHLPKKIVL